MVMESCRAADCIVCDCLCVICDKLQTVSYVTAAVSYVTIGNIGDRRPMVGSIRCRLMQCLEIILNLLEMFHETEGG